MQNLHHLKLVRIKRLQRSLKKADAAEFVMRVFVFALANYFCRNSTDNLKRFDVSCNHCTCGNHCTFANFKTWQNDCSWANKDIVSYFDRFFDRIKAFGGDIVL